MKERSPRLNLIIIAVVALCVCLAAASVGVVYAYLMSETDTVSNDFEPAIVSCGVEEVFENGVKSDVKVRNTGNTAAYIRAVVVVTFVDDEGKVLAVSPVEGVDYNVTWASEGWKKGSDGFWYHAAAIEPDAVTSNLIETAFAAQAPEGYSLNVQIIASAIQSEPATAVQEAWGIAPANGMLDPS
ncbi:MAG: hypothetical protein IKL24_00245 [Clostridia bacterium]|nr:hypothetical protein [Clostridia bacterium]